jgi:tocopherol O-methyltransferase
MPEILDAYQQSIVKYYDETRLDYRVLWLNGKNRAVHFGYYQEGISKHAEALENLNRVLAQTVGINERDHVLDAGCGQGGSAIWLNEQLGCRVSGITLVPHQVSVAYRETNKRGLNGKIDFTLGDYCRTPFPDNHFSVVWACESLCHTRNKIDFYKEAMRVLKPGGRLIIAEYIRTKRPLNNPEDETLLGLWLNKWSIQDIDTEAEHIFNMNAAGFANVCVKDITENVRPSLHRLFAISERLLPLGKVLQFFGLRNKVNHGNHVGSINHYLALEKKLWFYGIISAQKPDAV